MVSVNALAISFILGFNPSLIGKYQLRLSEPLVGAGIAWVHFWNTVSRTGDRRINY